MLLLKSGISEKQKKNIFKQSKNKRRFIKRTYQRTRFGKADAGKMTFENNRLKIINR
jgi:hypothetical protein